MKKSTHNYSGLETIVSQKIVYQKCYSKGLNLCNILTTSAENRVSHVFVSNTYLVGIVKGKRIIDIGSGPTIHSLIPAAKWFDELYLSDYCPQNLEAVQKWVRKDSGAHVWKGYFQFFAERDGDRYGDCFVVSRITSRCLELICAF